MEEAALVKALQNGDRAAFRVAVLSYSPQMLATARRIVGPAEAEDLVQEAWITVHRQIGSFEGRAKLSTWLSRIVSNSCISALRKRRDTVSLSGTEEHPDADWFDGAEGWVSSPVQWDAGTPEALLDADELQHCLEKHLENMDPTQRQVLLLRDTHEKSFAEICNAMELSASNARVLLHRGRLKLMGMVNHFQETGTC